MPSNNRRTMTCQHVDYYSNFAFVIKPGRFRHGLYEGSIIFIYKLITKCISFPHI